MPGNTAKEPVEKGCMVLLAAGGERYLMLKAPAPLPVASATRTPLQTNNTEVRKDVCK